MHPDFIHQACLAGRADQLRACLAAGIPADRTDRVGRTPLHMAACCELRLPSRIRPSTEARLEVVRLLLEAGAPIDPVWREETPLQQCAKWGEPEVARALIEAGASPGAGAPGSTPLLLAAREGRRAMVAALAAFDEGLGELADLTLHRWVVAGLAGPERSGLLDRPQREARDSHGWTPTHFAAALGSTPLLGMLLSLGASTAARTDEGLTPLVLACRSGQALAVRQLLDAGARPASRAHLTPRRPAALKLDPLLAAVVSGDLDTVHTILGARGARRLMRRDRRELLTYLVLLADIPKELVFSLLDAGARFSERSSWILLSEAWLRHEAEYAMALLAHGADPWAWLEPPMHCERAVRPECAEVEEVIREAARRRGPGRRRRRVV